MRVCVGQILGPHGVRGLVRLASFTAKPEAIAGYAPLTDEHGKRRFAVELLAEQKGRWLARIEGVDNRDAAEALAGTRLFVERENLAPLEEEEFYHADLIGLRAERPDGTALGTVVALHDFGAGDMVEVELPSGRRPVVPFTRAMVPVVDIGAGRIVIDAPADLLGDGKDEAGA